MHNDITRRAAIRSAAWAAPAVTVAAADPAYATSTTPTPTPCTPAKVKAVSVSTTTSGKGSARRYVHTVTVTLRSGLLNEIEVRIDGVPATLGKGNRFTSAPTRNDRPLVQVRSCGSTVYTGIVGRDC